MTSRRPRVVSSARLRILAWLLTLVALALTVTTGAFAAILTSQFRERLDAGLAHEIAAFRTLAAERQEVAGRPVRGVRDLLELATVMNFDAQNQTSLALVDGRVVGRLNGPVADAIAADPALTTRLATATQPAFGDAVTSVGCVRYAVLPVRFGDDPARGAFVTAASPDQQQADIVHTVHIAAGLGGLALLVAAVVGWLVAGHLLAPLRLLRDTARSITESDLTRRIPVRGTDELSQLSATFNTMLDRLEAAFAAQRQFLHDAGHELRTPITIIRGRLELLCDDPVQRAETIAVITDELDRMGRMVDDLFTLAQVRSPEYLRWDTVELSELVEDVYVKAETLAARRWLLEASPDPEPTPLYGDRQRLIQAFIQLAQNAVEHTGTGDEIRIGYAAGGGRARLWVTDTGPGIARTGPSARRGRRAAAPVPWSWSASRAPAA